MGGGNTSMCVPGAKLIILCSARPCPCGLVRRGSALAHRRLSPPSEASMPYINPVGIEKCRKRLSEAHDFFRLCKSSRSHEEFANNWADFLIKAAAIIHIMETASTKTPQGRQWHYAKKKQARKDPLTLYMYQARNAEEHGLEPLTELEPGGIGIGAKGQGVHIRHGVFTANGFFGIIGKNPDGCYPTAIVRPPQLHLLPVVDDRHRNTYAPPREHLGRPIEDKSPLGVGELYLKYLSDLIAEAEELARSP